MKVKVPLFRTARSVMIETDATNGAVVGENLRLADGTVVKPEDILNSEASSSPTVGQGSDLTTDDVTEGQFNEYFTDERAQASARTVIGRTLVAFAFGDASPRNIYVAPNNRTATIVRVVIDTAFDGAGAAIAIGTAADPELLMPYDGNDPATALSYENAPDAALNAGDAVQLSITPGAGATRGAGRIILDAYER